jgi:hypothetical protein
MVARGAGSIRVRFCNRSVRRANTRIRWLPWDQLLDSNVLSRPQGVPTYVGLGPVALVPPARVYFRSTISRLSLILSIKIIDWTAFRSCPSLWRNRPRPCSNSALLLAYGLVGIPEVR